MAREAPERAFLSLAHHIDIELLREAYRRTRKNGASGIDGQTAEQYEANLEENLQSLLDRFKSGRYHAPPVLRVHIPKDDGSKARPIGIPTFEDKVLQRAVAMMLTAVYEQDFLDCSYGFRPGRSAHQALNELWHEVVKMGGGWVYEVDIQSFFDELDHGHLRSFLDRKVRDGVLRRMIDKDVGEERGDDPSLRDSGLRVALPALFHHPGLVPGASALPTTLAARATQSQASGVLLLQVFRQLRGAEEIQPRLMSIWRRWLNRRSQRKTVTWERFWDYIKRNPLPRPVITHPAIP